ncbi:MAG: ribbon-helix-helix protein, CopG family [Gammaproteobacteria bacterium]|nr:ribbon-helix-helix protein, CopG family [Gammaproteobacteria bacterium]
MTTTVGVKLDNEIRDRLKALSELKHRSAHWIMREAIREYLDREEEIERRNLEADEAWEEYRRSGKGVSDEAMTAWLDSWGTDKEGPCPAPERLR